ncbi:hypothetical protein P154DRAFT_579646 [Amniculicola lignicola CBS 123094]|uniref:Uncharacterized protein n=1 Tax=Amniculicola lignicola CBS 123094 TaxID=1392246 RepID=A0A6A5W4D8_9PLEO|nr:hypothetical protein P154DRAFT_579646 [Amniculicola lignicola CBS 123094]
MAARQASDAWPPVVECAFWAASAVPGALILHVGGDIARAAVHGRGSLGIMQVSERNGCRQQQAQFTGGHQ